MEFRILGPFEVAQEGRVLPAAAHKPRAVLALLLLHRGEALSLERLADALWGERPPASAAKGLQVYVSQLRKLLGDSVLETRGRGYALLVEPGQIDAVRFERMLQQGIDQLAHGHAREAAATLTQALALWRGPALADFTYEPWAQGEIARLEDLRLAALEERIEADLALGRHSTLIGELEGLVEQHPRRERLCGQLMLALYRSGRQTEALEVFREHRRRTVDELGIEPGPSLRDIEAGILRQDASLEVPRRALAAPRERRRRGRVLAAAGAAALLIAALAAGLIGDEREPVAAPLQALPTSFCSPLAYQPGSRPRALIISDQDLRGDDRVLGAQVTAAVEFALRERRFKAGPHEVAFQACDSQDHDPEGAPSCEAKAKRYAANPAVIGVVGPLISLCAADVIPAANHAPAGPLAVVSPSSTAIGLTRSGTGSGPDEPTRFYPTGVRNFVRVIAADDFQIAGNAMLAQQLGIRRPFVLYDTEGNAHLADIFRSAAAKLALDVAGSTSWLVPDAAALIARIKRSRADGVLLAGALPTYGADVIKGLRAAFGANMPILATDGFSSPDLASKVGAASEGVRISVPGVDPQAVQGPARGLIDRLRETVGEPHPYAVSAVQATQLLLDAVARSDGTRPSVISELFTSEVRNGVLGDFSVTPAGDTTANQVTIYRIENGERRFDRVLTAAAESRRLGLSPGSPKGRAPRDRPRGRRQGFTDQAAEGTRTLDLLHGKQTL